MVAVPNKEEQNMRVEEVKGELVIVDFDEMEAYKIACKIEKDGIEFYQRLLSKLTPENDKAKKILSFLLNEEYEHLKFFEESLFRLRQKKEEDSEDEDILTSMDYGIFSAYQNIKELQAILDEPAKALRLGIAIEEKSIKFYECCRGHVTSGEVKQELAVIIDEEAKHKEVLADMVSHM